MKMCLICLCYWCCHKTHNETFYFTIPIPLLDKDAEIISLLFSSDGEDTVVLYKVLKFCNMPGSEPGPLCGRRETYANYWTTL